MKEQTHCQSCGAPIQIGECKCPYCDTPYPLSNVYELKIKIPASRNATNIRKSIEESLQASAYGLLTPNEVRVEYELDVLKNALRTEQLYAEALKAMREYSTK